MNEHPGVTFPPPENWTLVVFILGEQGDRDSRQVITHINLSNELAAHEASKFGFDEDKILNFLRQTPKSNHTMIFEVEVMKRDGTFL